MSLHYTLMGNTKRAQNQRTYHGQDQAVRQEDTLRDPEKDRLRNTLHGENAHVRDCLVWDLGEGSRQEGSNISPRSPRKYEPVKRTQRANEFTITSYKPLPRHPELGRAKNHLYGDDGPPHLIPKQRSNEGGVSDAMVGWPQERKLDEERQGRYGVGWDIDVRENKSPKLTRRNQRLEEGDSEAVMDELMAHRYMRDNEERLQQLKEQQMQDQVTVQRNRHTFRDNKASVLRAEAINAGAGAVREDQKDLWKMPRFTNAKSRLNDCTECKRHDCYHEDGRGFPSEPIRGDCKKCSKGNCKGPSEKGIAKGMGDKSGNRSQDETQTDRHCACCQNHHLQEPEEYPYYQHQQPEKQSYVDNDYPRNGLFVL